MGVDVLCGGRFHSDGCECSPLGELEEYSYHANKFDPLFDFCMYVGVVVVVVVVFVCVLYCVWGVFLCVAVK